MPLQAIRRMSDASVMSGTSRSVATLLTTSIGGVLAVALLGVTAAATPSPATERSDPQLAPVPMPVEASAPPAALAAAPVDTAPSAPTAPPAPVPVPGPAPAPAVPAPEPPAATPPRPSTPAPTSVPAPPPPAAPVRAAAPAPAPAPAPPAPPAPAESDLERVARALTGAVPGAWRAAVPVAFEIVPGSTSWASTTGRISVAADHLRSPELLADVLAHEFGHLIAFRYGTQVYAGAPPAGWPAPAHRPEEAWADCVQRVFLGRSNPSHGLAPCSGAQLAAAAEWLGQGPSAHLRTG